MRFILKAKVHYGPVLVSVSMLAFSVLAHAAPVPASKFAGTWLFKNQSATIKIIFTSAGRFTRIMNTGSGEETVKGAFSADSARITVRPDNDSEVIYLNFRFLNGNQLELTDDSGEGLRLVRQDATKPAPKVATPTKKPSATTAKPAASTGKRPATVVVRRFTEPREKAFTALVPKDWKVEGGIVRYSPDAVGAHNATDAKADITLKRDAAGTLQMRWLPDLLYADLSGKPYAAYTQIGTVFNNVIVLPKLGAEGYLVQAVLPRVFPNARNVKVLERKPLPKLAQLHAAPIKTLSEPFRSSFTFDALMVTVSFEENGKPYKARLVTAIEDMGALGGGLWQGMGTSVYRAPAAEFQSWLPVLGVIQGSVQWNMTWLNNELRESAKRRKQVEITEAELRRMDAEIVKNKQTVNAEINKQMYLNLTGQEEYVNPFTRKVETGSNEWTRRWQNSSGDIIYTDNTTYNPNADPTLQRQGFKLSKPRGR